MVYFKLEQIAHLQQISLPCRIPRHLQCFLLGHPTTHSPLSHERWCQPSGRWLISWVSPPPQHDLSSRSYLYHTHNSDFLPPLTVPGLSVHPPRFGLSATVSPGPRNFINSTSTPTAHASITAPAPATPSTRVPMSMTMAFLPFRTTAVFSRPN